jgi:hypothetical protein
MTLDAAPPHLVCTRFTIRKHKITTATIFSTKIHVYINITAAETAQQVKITDLLHDFGTWAYQCTTTQPTSRDDGRSTVQ